jgi:hypothetical protein
MSIDYDDIEWRRAVIHSGPVTLDGVKAVICGVRNDYATVKALPNGAGYEWSWQAVGRIMANGGAFHS